MAKANPDTTTLTERDWRVRWHIYHFFAEHSRPPLPAETAEYWDMSPDEAGDAFHALDAAHEILLEPGTTSVRIANPFSAVPTPFEVQVGERRYYANCALDAFGIPALLGENATIDAIYTWLDAPARFVIEQDAIRGDDDAVIHVLVPFRDWYEDQVHT